MGSYGRGEYSYRAGGRGRMSKAHTATANRIARKYNTTYNRGDGFDIVTDEMVIEVETSATLAEGIRRLKVLSPPVYVAVTNKEAVTEALRLVSGTEVGVMAPYGEIIRMSPPED